MKRVKVSFELEVVSHASHLEIRNWIGFELGKYGEIKNSNPLTDRDLECRAPIRIEIDGRGKTI